MARAIGVVAAGFGYLVRFVLFVTPVAVASTGFVLVGYGLYLFDARIGYIYAGLLAIWTALGPRKDAR